MTLALERFALIGDGETAALVSDHGSIDWLCLPRFDSPACCASLIGSAQHGYWSIRPEAAITAASQCYEHDTLILRTEMRTAEGAVRLTDFMPIRDRNPVVVRILEGLEGEVLVRATAALRFDYGRMPPWTFAENEDVTMQVGPDEVRLFGLPDARLDRDIALARVVVGPGDRHVFRLAYHAFATGDSERQMDSGFDTDGALAATREFWRDWIAHIDPNTSSCDPFVGSLRRSLLILKALIHRRSGGLVAAPTTSLPERAGGPMNWDYRYCWLRDASFTLNALVGSGYLQEARAWRDWLLRAAAGAPQHLQIMYRVDGSRRLDEAQIDWLDGYRYSKPVRIGNAAADQFQLDVYGELLHTFDLAERVGMERSEQGRRLERAVVAQVEQVWTRPDHGLWERRGERRHYTYSKVMAWVAMDRFLEGEGGATLARDDAAEFERLTSLRTHIRAVILEEGVDEGLGTFVEYFGGRNIDASLLLLPKVGFIDVDDERMAATIARIERELMVDGLVHRYPVVGLQPEGAFLACSFWLAECQLLQRRREAARATIQCALDVASPTGLLAEEFDLASRRMAGNYPQALSHLALVNAVLAFGRSGTQPARRPAPGRNPGTDAAAGAKPPDRG